MQIAVAFTVCSASAVTTLPSRPIWSSTTAAIGTSFVFLPAFRLRGDHRGGGVRAGQGREQADLWVPKTHATWAYAPRSHRVSARAWRLVTGLHAGGRAMIFGLWA